MERFYSKTLQKDIQNSPVFDRSFTGFTLLDPETGQVLCDVNGDHYFTPASNTKILTLYTCLHVLGDSLPGVQYSNVGDTLIFRGTGDPTFLHPQFQAWQPWFGVLKASEDSLIYYQRDFPTTRFGSGWAWDDYNEDYSAERSPFPVYGNLVHFSFKAGSGRDAAVSPSFFKNDFAIYPPRPDERIKEIKRYEDENLWVVPAKIDSADKSFPFLAVPVEALLKDTLHREISPIDAVDVSPHYWAWKTAYSTPVDTVYRRMMHESDNFIAEQLLLVCAGVKFDTLQETLMIRWAKDSLLQTLPDEPRWVDGSGLSRYNLSTPRNTVEVLRRLWMEQPRERLFDLFPPGGLSGTVSGWYKGLDGKPYLYAKSGSMSGVQCLSGYLINKKGKVLIFSFMHNNFVGRGQPWKGEMQRIFENIRDPESKK